MKVKNAIERVVTEKVPKKLQDFSNSIWRSKRLLVAIVMFLCFVNIAMIMYNINIAVVEMTSIKNITQGKANILRAEFQWDSVTISGVSCIHSYGGLFAFFGGYFVDKLGGSITCVMSMLVCGILTILHPVFLYLNFYTFLLCRFATGVFANSFFVSTAEIYSRWFPKKERSTLIAICYNGINVGAALVYPIFGYIAEKWGWQPVFYVSGIISILISLLCLIIVKNQPSQDEWISIDELSYILEDTDDAWRKEVPHPYKQIFSSMPVFAVCIGKFVLMWITTILTMSLPSYVKDLTGDDTDEIGIISSIPTLGQIFVFPIGGAVLDCWKKVTNMELTRIHKVAIGFSFLTSSACFLAAVLLKDFTTSMILFVTVQIVMSVVPAVVETIIVNISPNDSSVIATLGQLFACASIVISRTCFGYMTTHHSSQEWDNCFLLTSAVLICGVVIFGKFGSSDVQPWSLIPIFEQERSRLMK